MGLDCDRMRLYKPLASSLHPAGALPPMKILVLEMFSICPIMFKAFLKVPCAYKPWESKLCPAGAFSTVEVAFLEFLSMDALEKRSFFPGML